MRLHRLLLPVAAVVVLTTVWVAPTPASAESGTYKCTVTVGYPGPAADFTSTAGVSLGGCLLVQTSKDSVVTAMGPAPQCTISWSPVADVTQHTDIAVGATIPAASKVWAKCPAGTAGADNTLVLGDGGSTGTPPAGWRAPLAVASQDINEPHVVVAPDGTVYFSATRRLYRSRDGGLTFTDVSPKLTDAPPAPFTDTSVSVAPDGTLWWTRFWGYPGSTLGCRSLDRGDSWSCDNTAIPGATDRMWIAGLSKDVAYLQTMQGLVQPIWAKTDNGGVKYVPYATWGEPYAWNGNMVYDTVHKAVWQLMRTTGANAELLLIRVDTATGAAFPVSTGIPRDSAFPYLAVAGGVLWTTGEKIASDGSRLPVAARSTDQGATWRQFDLPTPAKSVTFSTVAAGPNGHVAVVYYGSDKAGTPAANGGNWSLYINETTDGGAATPTWTTTRLVDLVHTGSICAGVNCEAAGGDTKARSMGDFMGSWIDGSGSVHVAYQSDGGDGISKAMYMRQNSGAATARATTLTVGAAATSGQFSDGVPVSARLTDGSGQPVPRAPVSFALQCADGASTTEAVTGDDGVAVATLVVGCAPGGQTLVASYPGTAGVRDPSAASKPFTVLRDDSATVVVAEPKRGAERPLRATVTDADSPAKPLVGVPVTFFADGTRLGEALTDAYGVARLTATAPDKNADSYRATTPGNEYYQGSSGSV
ncbi:MAG: hypothetical protein QOE05_299 [Actinomycetota bacterium]|jgi:hypothetical protein|nr:hypothetical protein [Actinomycetota bacterium]